MRNPAGSYQDPSNAPQTRYWTGGRWTDETEPFDPPWTPRKGKQALIKKRGNAWILAGAVVACFAILMALISAGTKHVDSYGNSIQGGPTVGTFVVIILGIVLAAIGFCIRLLGATEKR